MGCLLYTNMKKKRRGSEMKNLIINSILFLLLIPFTMYLILPFAIQLSFDNPFVQVLNILIVHTSLYFLVNKVLINTSIHWILLICLAVINTCVFFGVEYMLLRF